MMANDREGIPSKLRFEIFKFDSFTCQYCGRKAPEHNIFVVDHLHPVALGGTNEIYNLITACEKCNLGKGDIPLSDLSRFEDRIKRMKENEFLERKAEFVRNGVKIIIDNTEASFLLQQLTCRHSLKITFSDEEKLLANGLLYQYRGHIKAYGVIWYTFNKLQKRGVFTLLTRMESTIKLLEESYYYGEEYKERIALENSS